MNDVLIYNLTIDHGSDYSVHFRFEDDDDTPISLAGWTVEATLREFPECHVGIDFLPIADSEGIHLYLSSTDTENLGYQYGVYDVFITTPDNNCRVQIVTGRTHIRARSAR